MPNTWATDSLPKHDFILPFEIYRLDGSALVYYVGQDGKKWYMVEFKADSDLPSRFNVTSYDEREILSVIPDAMEDEFLSYITNIDFLHKEAATLTLEIVRDGLVEERGQKLVALEKTINLLNRTSQAYGDLKNPEA